MDTAVKRTILDKIRSDRHLRNQVSTQDATRIRNETAARGALGNSRFPMLIEGPLGQELAARGQLWFEIAAATIEAATGTWDSATCDDVEHLIQVELVTDNNSLHEILKRFTGGGVLTGALESGWSRAKDTLAYQLGLKRLGATKARAPLADELATERYAAVNYSWKKATAFLRGTSPDLPNAAKEATLAVEAMVKVVLGTDKGTLGAGIKELGNRGLISKPLLGSFEDLYGFVNQSPAVRHAYPTPANLSEAEALYVYQSSHAILQYLMAIDPGPGA